MDWNSLNSPDDAELPGFSEPPRELATPGTSLHPAPHRALARASVSLLLVCLTFSSAGCYTTHAGAGALAGAGLGGTMGALIGGPNGRAGSGAVLGAMTGAVIGGLAGDAEDAREERDVAVAQARYAEYERDVASRQAITNYDLISMAQAGLSDQVILNAVQTRGGNFDLSPSAIIELKSRGVSENVIMSIQKTSTSGSYRSSPIRTTSTTIIDPGPDIYIVRPRPTTRVGFFIGPRPRYRHYHHSHWHW